MASRCADLVALTKPRLNFLVVLTTLAGYHLGSAGYDLARLFHTVVGTALVAGGAAAFNQLLERDTDALMRRTQTRPLPGGRLEPGAAGAFAAVLSVVGLGQLALGVNLLAAAVAAVTLLSYVTIYTPLKRRTPLATLMGGVPGALPAVIGWAAARNSLSVEGWALFGLVFFWQMPHFLAIAWMCRDDYARAGLPMLPVVEPDGRSTGVQVVLYAATLIPVSLLPSMLGTDGSVVPRWRASARPRLSGSRRRVRAPAERCFRPEAVLRIYHVPAARSGPPARQPRLSSARERRQQSGTRVGSRRACQSPVCSDVTRLPGTPSRPVSGVVSPQASVSG